MIPLQITGASGKKNSQGDLTELCLELDVDPGDCPADDGQIVLEVTCNRTGQTVKKRVTSRGAGTYSYCFDQSELSDFDCACDDSITVRAVCKKDGETVSATDWDGTIDCPDCPQFRLSKQSEGSCVGSKRKVTVCANFSSVPANTTVQWYFNGNPGQAKAVSSGTGQICTTKALPSGQSNTVELRVVSPSGCQGKQITLTPSSCPGGNCPQFTLQKQSEGDCNEAGTERDVTVCANFSSVPSNTVVQWFVNGNYGPTKVSPGTGQYCETLQLKAGQSNTVELRVISPSGCQNKQITVTPSDCPGDGGNCPQFTLQKQSEGDCNEAGTEREVTVCANFSNVPSNTVVQWYFNGNPGNATPVAPGTGQICETKSLQDGQSSTVELKVISPSGCQSKQITVTPTECPDGKCPKPTGITANPGDCEGKKRKVTLSTTVTNGGSGDKVTWNFGDGTQSTPIDLGNNADADVTHSYAAPGSGTHQYTVTVVVNPQDSDCTVETHQRTITIQGCGGDEECPPLNDKPTANVDGCENGKRKVTFQPPQTASGVSKLEWDFGDGTTTSKQPNQTVTHHYKNGGTYTVTVTAKGPGECEDSSSIEIDIEDCCPSLNDKPTANVDGCENGKRKVTFQPPQTASGVNKLEWDFGDGNTDTTQPNQSVTHRYGSGGTYTVTVTAKGPGQCEDSSSTTINFEGCGDNGNGGSSFACGIARVGTAVLAAMAIFTALLALCIPGAAQALGIAAGVLAVGAVVLGAVFGALCNNKPCKWALLMTAQVALGAGLGAAIFSLCCNWLLWAGLGLAALGLVLFVVWKRECNESWCTVAKEVTYVVSGIVLTLVGIASSIPVITGCIDPNVLAIVSAIAGPIAAYAAAC